MKSSSIIRVKELTKCTGLSRSTIWRLEMAGQFPRRVLLTSKIVGWRREEVMNWINQRKPNSQNNTFKESAESVQY